jgi:hypothetical protein
VIFNFTDGTTYNSLVGDMLIQAQPLLDLTVLLIQIFIGIYTNSLFVIILPTRSWTENVRRKNTRR